MAQHRFTQVHVGNPSRPNFGLRTFVAPGPSFGLERDISVVWGPGQAVADRQRVVTVIVGMAINVRTEIGIVAAAARRSPACAAGTEQGIADMRPNCVHQWRDYTGRRLAR
jgi:hypothetical protein